MGVLWEGGRGDAGEEGLGRGRGAAAASERPESEADPSHKGPGHNENVIILRVACSDGCSHFLGPFRLSCLSFFSKGYFYDLCVYEYIL